MRQLAVLVFVSGCFRSSTTTEVVGVRQAVVADSVERVGIGVVARPGALSISATVAQRCHVETTETYRTTTVRTSGPIGAGVYHDAVSAVAVAGAAAITAVAVSGSPVVENQVERRQEPSTLCTSPAQRELEVVWPNSRLIVVTDERGSVDVLVPETEPDHGTVTVMAPGARPVSARYDRDAVRR
jgi:hypothetical protein